MAKTRESSERETAFLLPNAMMKVTRYSTNGTIHSKGTAARSVDR